MTRPANFADAHRRHWEDAELLFEHERWSNADQLYGFSAECGLKAVMQTLGMRVDAAGKPEMPQHRKHVQELWSVFRTFAEGRNGEWYLSRLPEEGPFRDWSPDDRYASGGHYSRPLVEPHRHATMRILQMIQQARQDGRS